MPRERWRHAAFLELPRQQREPHQQVQQVGEQHPLVLYVRREPAQAAGVPDADEPELVARNYAQPGQCDL